MHISLKPNAELNGAFDFAFIQLLGASAPEKQLWKTNIERLKATAN